MNQTVYQKISEKCKKGEKMLAVLLDPDKCCSQLQTRIFDLLEKNTPDFIFVGGSHTINSTDLLIENLKKKTTADIVLFPGNASQFTNQADALLYLSLISGRNPEFLITQHIQSALAIKKTGLEVIPTGYILIDGGKITSVQYISNTFPIPADKPEITVSTAVAGQLLGMKLIYLEAGSGARFPVTSSTISATKSAIDIPLIVGGGIKTIENLEQSFRAGADLVVVGNLFETQPGLIPDFIACSRHFNEK